VQVEGGGAAFVSVVGCGKVKGVVFISTLSVTRRGEILCGRVRTTRRTPITWTFGMIQRTGRVCSYSWLRCCRRHSWSVICICGGCFWPALGDGSGDEVLHDK